MIQTCLLVKGEGLIMRFYNGPKKDSLAVIGQKFLCTWRNFRGLGKRKVNENMISPRGRSLL